MAAFVMETTSVRGNRLVLWSANKVYRAYEYTSVNTKITHKLDRDKFTKAYRRALSLQTA